MAIIEGLSDKNVSYSSVKMTQKSCFLMVAEPAQCDEPGSLLSRDGDRWEFYGSVSVLGFASTVRF